MPVHRNHLRAFRAGSLAMALACASGAYAAITVTHTSVAQGPSNDILLSYRLNELATSVQIQLSGGQTFAGGTEKGLNSVSLPLSAGTQTATITATAPAPDGPGGAGVIVPPIFPDNRATPASTNLIGVDVVKRAGSEHLGNIYLPAGFSQAGQKYVWVYAPDGTFLFSKNLSDVYPSSGSWPYGVAVARQDPLDRVVVHNRSAASNVIFTPDLAVVATQPAGFLVPGMAITPGSGNADQPWNIWQSGGKTKDVLHSTSDLATNAGRTLIGAVAQEVMTGGENVHDLTVDVTNRIMFKAQVTDGGVGPISEGGANKWVNDGFGWTEDTLWLAGFQSAVAADLLAAGSTLTTADLVAGGVSLAPGFNAANPSASSVWFAVSGGPADNFWNRIYRVNAATGAIQQTIDVTQIPTPENGVAFADKAVHFIETDHAGNLLITQQTGVAMNGQFARYFGILAPNAASNTTSLSGVSLEVPPSATVVAAPERVANTGNEEVTFTATVTDFDGILANNVQVTADLTALGGEAAVPLTRGTVSPDGSSAPFTLTYTVPADVDLANSGTFEIPFTVTGSAYPGGFIVRQSVMVYNAYAPSWTFNTGAPINSSPATSGNIAFFGDDAGNVYAVNADTGQPMPNFAGGGPAKVGGAVTGTLVHHNGRLYVSTTQGVYILNSGTGKVLASRALANVSSLDISPLFPGAVFVAAGNQIYKLNALNANQMGVSPDLGAQVNRVALVPTNLLDANFNLINALVVAGTEGDNQGLNGKIIVLNPVTMAGILTDSQGAVTVAPFVDPNGPVRSRATWGNNNGNYFAIGGASGLWAVDADNGTLLPWTAGSGGGANVGGNPYTPGAPVDANPDVPLSNVAPYREDVRIAFATRGNGANGGQLYVLTQATGERSSYGGYPVPLTAPGSGFGSGAGVLAVAGETDRTLYIGSDINDQRFFALDTRPDDVSYQATAAKTHIFDPSDTSVFPNAVAGAFNSTPALACDTVVVGSTASRAYGFPSLTEVPPCVVSVTPANGATGVSTNPSIQIVFSTDMSAVFFDNTTVQLLDEAGNEVPATASLGVDGMTLTVQPSSALTNQKTYYVVVSPTIAQSFSSSFFVGTPPVVQYDVNNDGVFNLEDVKALIRIAGGLAPATTQAMQQGDLTAPNGRLTIEDAVALRKRLP